MARRNNIIAPISLILFLGSIIYLSVEIAHNNKLEDGLKNERLHSESMLSEKLLLEKEIHKRKIELKELSDEKLELEKLLENTASKLNSSESELSSLKGIKNLALHLEKKNKELLNQETSLESQLNKYQRELEAVQASNDDLQLGITLLKQQNDNLIAEARAWRLSTLNAPLIESVNKTNKLTVRAKRIRKLKVSVDMSAEVEKLNFRIVDPSGKELNDQNETVSIKTETSGNQFHLPFYLEGGLQKEPLLKRVEMTYSPKQKLVSGLYTIRVLSDSELIGSLQVKLR